ncbi:transposase [Streptomyces hokutonensis]|uniref:transposase n=1 Tax=Streptomyces hokutonensis TaxID=1306990 RepID=UPI003F53E718
MHASPAAGRSRDCSPSSTTGWDGGKKGGGRKRHLVVNCLGLVPAVAVSAASVQDRDAAVPLL